MPQSLVVDDSPILRRILNIMLESLGFTTFEADRVEAALALCQENLPDIVLIDWTLPDQDGVSLVQLLRRLPGGEKMKLILCTLERSVTHIETALAAGADEYITKPFGLDVLETKLGYLGFTLPECGGDAVKQSHNLGLRRQISRLGFAGMTIAERDEAAFSAGESLFRQGDIPDFAYILLDGKVRLTGGPESAQSFGAFDLIGETALIDTSPRSATAVAETDCKAMRLPRARFQVELATLSPLMRSWIECRSERGAER